ncbi:hypothetical protein Tco_1098453, partial [Tanacetum coccineum]
NYLTTSAGNLYKRFSVYLNLPDHEYDPHRISKLTPNQTWANAKPIPDDVLKLKNFKKDATLKLSKSSNQEWYEHVGPEVASPQDGKVSRWRKEIMLG